MAANPPSNSKSSGDNRGADQAPAPLTFEDKLNQFWQKNRTIVFGLCVLVLAAILGKGLYDNYQSGREKDLEAAYATAKTPDQLQAFANANSGHELAGIAELQIADQAYSAGKSADAATAYDKAISSLKPGPLQVRAKLGRALTAAQEGKTSDAIDQLKQIANDSTLLNAPRAEAAYQLASLSAGAGNTADVEKYVGLLNQIDPASPWARRAMMLQASLPVPAAAASSATSSTGSNLQINLPKK